MTTQVLDDWEKMEETAPKLELKAGRKKEKRTKTILVVSALIGAVALIAGIGLSSIKDEQLASGNVENTVFEACADYTVDPDAFPLVFSHEGINCTACVPIQGEILLSGCDHQCTSWSVNITTAEIDPVLTTCDLNVIDIPELDYEVCPEGLYRTFPSVGCRAGSIEEISLLLDNCFGCDQFGSTRDACVEVCEQNEDCVGFIINPLEPNKCYAIAEDVQELCNEVSEDTTFCQKENLPLQCFPGLSTFAEAQDFCASLGGYMAEVQNDLRLQRILGLCPVSGIGQPGCYVENDVDNCFFIQDEDADLNPGGNCDIERGFCCEFDTQTPTTAPTAAPQVSTFTVIPEETDFGTAVELCAAKGETLVTIGDQRTQDEVWDICFAAVQEFGNPCGCWIGMVAAAFPDPQVKESFFWIDDTEEDFFFFELGQPNNADDRNEGCVHMRPFSDGGWNDLPCLGNCDATDQKPFPLCEKSTRAPTKTPTQSPTTSEPTTNPTTSPTDSPTVSPTTSPTSSPTTPAPTDSPTVSPTPRPTNRPSDVPTTSPTKNPTTTPTVGPTENPTVSPTKNPTVSPTTSPTDGPTTSPTSNPTDSPTTNPTTTPTFNPTKLPTTTPTFNPTKLPTTSPTKTPTVSPTDSPTTSPTKNPTVSPTTSPTDSPTKNPTTRPTDSPTTSPTTSPTRNPTSSPTDSPTKNPTTSPTRNPTSSPTKNPTISPTKNPTVSPTTSPTDSPTKNPTTSPTTNPTQNPTTSPTERPTKNPTTSPTTSPTKNPTNSPTTSPTKNPTTSPTANPTLNPTVSPTPNPTNRPSDVPTTSPTRNPTTNPTVSPTKNPTVSPTTSPTDSPTTSPTTNPTVSPTTNPTVSPTDAPTDKPTVGPTASPTVSPTVNPTVSPTKNPTISPTVSPTTSPTTNPTVDPTVNPTTSPTTSPTTNPTVSPTTNPTVSPTKNPTTTPTTSPTTTPTQNPTQLPTVSPTVSPTEGPTRGPTRSPTRFPTNFPTPSPTNDDKVDPVCKFKNGEGVFKICNDGYIEKILVNTFYETSHTRVYSYGPDEYPYCPYNCGYCNGNGFILSQGECKTIVVPTHELFYIIKGMNKDCAKNQDNDEDDDDDDDRRMLTGKGGKKGKGSPRGFKCVLKEGSVVVNDKLCKCNDTVVNQDDFDDPTYTPGKCGNKHPVFQKWTLFRGAKIKIRDSEDYGGEKIENVCTKPDGKCLELRGKILMNKFRYDFDKNSPVKGFKKHLDTHCTVSFKAAGHRKCSKNEYSSDEEARRNGCHERVDLSFVNRDNSLKVKWFTEKGYFLNSKTFRDIPREQDYKLYSVTSDVFDSDTKAQLTIESEGQIKDSEPIGNFLDDVKVTCCCIEKFDSYIAKAVFTDQGFTGSGARCPRDRSDPKAIENKAPSSNYIDSDYDRKEIKPQVYSLGVGGTAIYRFDSGFYNELYIFEETLVKCDRSGCSFEDFSEDAAISVSVDGINFELIARSLNEKDAWRLLDSSSIFDDDRRRVLDDKDEDGNTVIDDQPENDEEVNDFEDTAVHGDSDYFNNNYQFVSFTRGTCKRGSSHPRYFKSIRFVKLRLPETDTCYKYVQIEDRSVAKSSSDDGFDLHAIKTSNVCCNDINNDAEWEGLGDDEDQQAEFGIVSSPYSGPATVLYLVAGFAGLVFVAAFVSDKLRQRKEDTGKEEAEDKDVIANVKPNEDEEEVNLSSEL